MERRRWNEENRVRIENPNKNRRHLLSSRELTWERTERRRHQRNTLKRLRLLSPQEFEKKVANAFNAQGYTAEVVGGTFDNGVDVAIRTPEGDLWAVAQCKRYAERNRVSSNDIRAFAGSFLLSGATKGFFITTGGLTRHARKTASHFPWLTVLTNRKTAQYLEKHLCIPRKT